METTTRRGAPVSGCGERISFRKLLLVRKRFGQNEFIPSATAGISQGMGEIVGVVLGFF
jgi:hypothetical protein